MSRKQTKEEKKLLRKIRKMEIGDDMKLKGYELICIDPKFYLLIHQEYGILEKHYNEIEDWILGEDL